MRTTVQRTSCLLVTAWLVATSGAFGADNPPRFSGERADVISIEIPVQVVRDGQPVRGLTAADFEVYDGRKKQDIVGFEVVDLTTQAAATTEAAPERLGAASRRHFLMLFDLSNSEPKSIANARAAAQGVVGKLHPTDLVAVSVYSAAKGPQLALGFTSDRRQIARAIDTLGLPELVKRSGDPLNLVIETFSTGSGAVQPVGGRAAEVLEQDAKEDASRSKANDRRYEEQRLAAYTRSLAELGKLMGNVDGRKYVVLLSEGFDSALILGTQNQEELTQINRAVESGETWNVDNDARFGNTKSGNELERMLEELRRADCVIQAVDIGGLRGEGDQGFRRPNGQDGLFAMAQGTGGELFRNFNDLSVAMEKMLERTSHTYVLAIQPDVKPDGSYHKLKVELKNGGRGTRVSARAGFYAPKPFADRDATSRLLDAADAILSGREAGALDVAVLATPFRGARDKAYVPVLVEIDGPGLLAGTTGSALPTELYAYAIAADGTIGDFFGQTLGLDLAKVQAPLAQSGLKYFGHLELAPGRYSLRVLVRNGRTGNSGLRVVDLAVPAFDAGGAAVLSPCFPEPQGKWLMVREQPRGEQKDAAYPFMLAAQAYVPASRPVLTAGQEVRFALPTYNLGAGEVEAQAKVLDAEGREIPGGALRLLDRERGAGAADVLAASFAPTGLKPGAYRLRVLVRADGTALEAPPISFVVR